jgi:hypothetical protein
LGIKSPLFSSVYLEMDFGNFWNPYSVSTGEQNRGRLLEWHLFFQESWIQEQVEIS